MTPSARSRLLLVNGLVLGTVAVAQTAADLVAYWAGAGPTGPLLHGRYEAIGFVEAHGLAAIVAIVLILRRADQWRGWHGIALATHALLGVANLVFWQIFTEENLLVEGIAATTMHGVFLVLHLVALATTQGRRFTHEGERR